MKKVIIKFMMCLSVYTILNGCNWGEKEKIEISGNVYHKRNIYNRVIAGSDENIGNDILEKGKVLLSYSDCYTCHKESQKHVGPSFTVINLRYPRNEVFIRILAKKVIYGGSGAWGHAKMSSHPQLSEEDAKAMVSYILSFSGDH